jgi:hypothetical protein
MKQVKYDPYFTINGVGVHSKAYAKETLKMYFYTQDGKLLTEKNMCSRNYTWPECKKLFGD